MFEAEYQTARELLPNLRPGMMRTNPDRPVNNREMSALIIYSRSEEYRTRQARNLVARWQRLNQRSFSDGRI